MKSYEEKVKQAYIDRVRESRKGEEHKEIWIHIDQEEEISPHNQFYISNFARVKQIRYDKNGEPFDKIMKIWVSTRDNGTHKKEDIPMVLYARFYQGEIEGKSKDYRYDKSIFLLMRKYHPTVAYKEKYQYYLENKKAEIRRSIVYSYDIFTEQKKYYTSIQKFCDEVGMPYERAWLLLTGRIPPHLNKQLFYVHNLNRKKMLRRMRDCIQHDSDKY